MTKEEIYTSGVIVIVLILLALLIIGFVFGYHYGSHENDTCITGQDNIAGDFTPKNINCAISDCLVFNEYSKKNVIPAFCVV